MKKFLVTHKQTHKTMLFTFDLKGFLIAFKTDLVMSDAIVNYFNTAFPFKLSQLEHYRKNKVFKVDEVLQDISFKAFWLAFNNKVGNKTRAEKLWNALKDTEKAKALNYIPTYNNYLILNQGIQKLYPETYLSQKRFNND